MRVDNFDKYDFLHTFGVVLITIGGAGLSVFWTAEGGWDNVFNHLFTYIVLLCVVGSGAAFHLIGTSEKGEKIILPPSQDLHIKVEQKADSSGSIYESKAEYLNHPAWRVAILTAIGYLSMLTILTILLVGVAMIFAIWL